MTCFAADKAFDLMKISQLGSKGRIQDQEYQPHDPQIDSILSMGKQAIPLLIEAIASERPYGRSPQPLWPRIVEGDVALIVLSDLFLDPTWRRSTLPELCWDNLLGRTNRDLPAWDLLQNFLTTHGRAALVERWREAWAKHGSRIMWNPDGRFFQVEGRDLMPCA
jgi:hypothetical protein